MFFYSRTKNIMGLPLLFLNDLDLSRHIIKESIELNSPIKNENNTTIEPELNEVVRALRNNAEIRIGSWENLATISKVALGDHENCHVLKFVAADSLLINNSIFVLNFTNENPKLTSLYLSQSSPDGKKELASKYGSEIVLNYESDAGVKEQVTLNDLLNQSIDIKFIKSTYF